MIINNDQSINAIIINNDLVKKVYIGSNEVYNQNLSDLKLLFLDGFTLEKVNDVPLGE